MFGAPLGMSDLRAAYRPWWLLNTAQTMRGVAIEKRAIPMLLGEYQIGSQKPGLEAALARAKSQNWLAVPPGVKVTLLNIAGSSDEIFAKACKDWSHEIFLGIQGAILQSLEGLTTDGRGSSKVHKSTADLFKWFLSACWVTVINELIVDLIDLNYPTDKYPEAELSAVDVAELTQEANVLKILNGIGLDLSKADVYSTFGRNPPDNDADILKGATPKPPGGGGDQPPPEEAAMRRDTSTQLDDATPAAEVAGLPFRFSEEWQRWLRS